MNKLVYDISSIIGFILLLGVVHLILNFFSISFADYSTYLFWIIALLIFYAVLPGKHLYFEN